MTFKYVLICKVFAEMKWNHRNRNAYSKIRRNNIHIINITNNNYFRFSKATFSPLSSLNCEYCHFLEAMTDFIKELSKFSLLRAEINK